MLSNLFRQLVNSCGVVIRTFRAFFMRQIMGVKARIRRITSFSRQAAKLVPKAMNSVAVAGKKPTKREDFVETKRLFVAKSFIYLFIVGAVAVGLLIYFLVVPWLVSKFFTKSFFEKDEAIEAYSGKVIVCYDEAKKEPKFQGRLTEGVLSGAVKEYDEEGRIVYDGAYLDGLRSGRGMLYDAGVLVYDGEFVAGLYEGSGTLYEGGRKLYEGSFAGGEYDGSGRLYDGEEKLAYEGGFTAGVKNGTGSAYADGVICYKGGFADGVYNGDGKTYYANGQLAHQGGYIDGLTSGEGTEFFENGAVKFKGSFLAGEYEGDGVLYTEDGFVKYTGGFLSGLYEGQGVLRVDGSMRVEGVFEHGEIAGEARIYIENKLWYEGEVEGYIPNGQGKLYASDGKLIYEGNMIAGVADIGAMLDMAAADVRAMFGEAELIETPGDKAGFSITNEALGVTLFCTYKQESDDPTVYYVYAYDKNSDALVNAMPFRSAAEYEAASSNFDKREREEKATFTGGVPYEDGTYYRTAYYYDDYVFVGWSEKAGGEFLMVEWVTQKSLPAAGSGAYLSAGSARLTDVLASLSLISANEGAPKAAASEFYGTKSLADAVKMLYGSARNAALTQAAEYYAAAENLALYNEELALYTSLLTDERRLIAMGNGDEALATELEAAVNGLELSVAKAKLAMKKAEKSAGETGIAELSALDVSKALLCADPENAEREALIARGGDDAENAFMELDVAYLELQQKLEAYKAADADAQGVLADYAAGRADGKARADAVAARCEAAAALNQSLAACTKLWLEIDTATFGMAAQVLGYFTL